MSTQGPSDTARVAGAKRALYHHERGRVFRPTRSEHASGAYTCPYCKGSVLKKVRFRADDHALSCPSCHWTIHRDDIWSPLPDSEPEVREVGDATRDSPDAENAEPSIDMSLEEMTLPPAPALDISLADAAEEDLPPAVVLVG